MIRVLATFYAVVLVLTAGVWVVTGHAEPVLGAVIAAAITFLIVCWGTAK